MAGVAARGEAVGESGEPVYVAGENVSPRHLKRVIGEVSAHCPPGWLPVPGAPAPCSVPWHRIPIRDLGIGPLSYACAGAGSPGSACQPRPISRSIGGYTIRCRNGLIAAM